ncbi:hypothetical protein Tco_0160939, partial [Tanacetum coccineum]
ETQTNDFDTCESDCSVKSLSEPTVNEPKVVSQPKVWSDAPIIEEYESDSEDQHVSQPTEDRKHLVELNNQKGKGSSQREIRPVWNNVQRVNHKNHFIPIAVLTRTGKISVSTASASGTNNVSTARHNFNSQAVNTAEVNAVSVVGRKRETAVKPSADVIIGEPKGIIRIESPNTIVGQ